MPLKTTFKDFPYKEAMLYEMREYLADMHERNTQKHPEGHSAIAFCQCRVAQNYRRIKRRIHTKKYGS